MFEHFYQLRQQPFGTNPDPRFLYLSRTHREAYSSLLYRVQTDAGFLAMVAQPGMGKTTLLFHLLQRLQHTTRTAFIFHTQCTSHELLRHLLSEFECDTSITDPVRISRELKSVLLAEAKAGRRCVLIIDEAQNLQPDVLETIRLLSNFETPSRKLLNIILSGQAELGELLYRPGLQQLRQRLSCIIHIDTFAPAETALYIANRLNVAGYSGELSHIFTVPALALIDRLSSGIPRVINNICFNAMSLGYALESTQIDVPIIEEVARDLGLSLQLQLSPSASIESSFLPRPVDDNAPSAKWEEALAAISTVCIRQRMEEQAESDSVQELAITDAPEVLEDRSASPAEMGADISKQDDEAAAIRPEDAFPITHDAIAEPHSSPAECASDNQSTQALTAAPVDAGNRWGKFAGLIGVRACLCAVLLCIAPALDGPSRHSVSAQKSVGFMGENLPSRTTIKRASRNVIRHVPENRRYSHPAVSGGSPDLSQGIPRDSHGPNGEIEQIWKATHDPSVVGSLTTASPVPKQLVETRPLDSLPATPHVAPADKARFDARPGNSLPANRGRAMSTCREEEPDGTSAPATQHDNHTHQETLCSSFSIGGAADTR